MNQHRSFFIFSIAFFDTILLYLFGALTYGISTQGSLNARITSYDASIANAVGQATPHWLFVGMSAITYLADPVVMIVLAIIVLIILVHIHEEEMGALLTGSMVIGGLLSLAIKAILLRPRPTTLSDIDRFGSSFPSAHVLVSIIFYGFLAYALGRVYAKAWQRTLLYISAAVVIAAIGYSRIVIGAHWFSDVVGGWLLGGAILGTLIILLLRIEEWHAKKWHPDRTLMILFIILAASAISFLAVFDLMRYTM